MNSRGARGAESKVSFLIINYNGARFLDACIQSIFAQTYPEKEVIVCDNDSRDESEAVCSRYPVKFLKLGGNLGIGGAANRGAKIAQGKYISLMNADIKLSPDCTGLLADALEKHLDAFAADPTQLDWEGQKLIHGRTWLEKDTIFSAEMGRYSVRYTGHAEEAVQVPFACAGCMLMRRDRFESLGGFDEKFFLEWEDADICWRAWRRGWATIYVPQARVYHYVGFSSDAELEKVKVKARPMDQIRQTSYYENLLRFVIKGMPPGIAAATWLRLVCLLPPLIIFRPEVGRAIGTGIKNVIRDINLVLAQRREIRRTEKLSSKNLIKMFSDT